MTSPGRQIGSSPGRSNRIFRGRTGGVGGGRPGDQYLPAGKGLNNFLDSTVTNNLNYSYDFAVYRKPAITSVQKTTFHLPKHSYGSI